MGRNKEFDIDTALLQAMDLFWAQGYEKTSIQDLLNTMGIHRKSLYDTFGDKHELFMAVIDRYQQMVHRIIEQQMKKGTSIKEIIRNLFYMVIDHEKFSAQGCLFVNMAVELVLHDEDVRRKSQEIFNNIETLFYELLLQGQKTGEISANHDALILAQYFLNAWTGIRVLVKTMDDRTRFERIIDTTLQVLE